MGRRTVTPAVREVGATIVAVLLAPGVAAVVATLLAVAVATIMTVMLMLVAGPALAKVLDFGPRSLLRRRPGTITVLWPDARSRTGGNNRHSKRKGFNIPGSRVSTVAPFSEVSEIPDR
jgi:hypothetical protein